MGAVPISGFLYTCFLVPVYAQPTVASPVKAIVTPSCSVYLSVLLTLFFVLSLLLIIKHIFMKRRRAKSAHNQPQPYALGCSFTVDSYHRSSASVLPSPSCLDMERKKSGLMIGFFGSPAWETRRVKFKKYEQSSFMYQLHTESRRHRSSRPRSTVHGSASILDARQSRPLSVSNIVDSRALYEIQDATGQKRSLSLRLPKPPSKAHTSPSNIKTSRRFSLPILHRRRPSSLKSTKSRRSDASASSFPGNSSLRLVETSKILEPPLPLSPQAQPYLSAAASVHPTDSKTSTHQHRSFIPPLPPLPPLPWGISSSQYPQPTSTDLQKPTFAPIHISHPYALAKNPKQTLQKTVMSSFDPQALPSLANTYTSDLPPAAVLKADCQSPTVPRHPFASVIRQLEIPLPSPTLTPNLSSFPCPPISTVVSPIIKRKTSPPSIRVRRSPAIGPSPLRTMILPDPSFTEITFLQASDKENIRTKDRPTSSISTYSHLGLEYPHSRSGTGGESESEEYPSGSARGGAKSAINRIRSNGSERRVSKTGDDDPNVLLGIIRELVEETNEWDSSLFVDENFKAMIESSRGLSSVNAGNDRYNWAETAGGRSVEVDLTLLGLDIFRSDGPSHAEETGLTNHAERPGEGSMFVSFWEESDPNRSGCVRYHSCRTITDPVNSVSVG